MRTELISIPTETIPLDGALHRPDGAATGAVLLFHGNTMNFYVGAPQIPAAGVDRRWATRVWRSIGADTIFSASATAAPPRAPRSNSPARASRTTASPRAGWRERGFPPPVVIGHSNGGMLAVPHVVAHPDTPAMILLSAHGGGKDGVLRVEPGRADGRRPAGRRSRPRRERWWRRDAAGN